MNYTKVLIPEVSNRVTPSSLSKKLRQRDIQKLDRLFAVLKKSRSNNNNKNNNNEQSSQLTQRLTGQFVSQKEQQVQSILIPSYDQLIPHLYPVYTRDPLVTTYQSQDITLKNLALSFLTLKILEHNISVYKRSSYDINNFDFNYLSKVSSRQRQQQKQQSLSSPPSITLLVQDPKNTYSLGITPMTIPKLLKQFLTSNNLTGLANLSTWTDHVPSRMRSTLDNHTLLILLGELIRANSPCSQRFSLLEFIVNSTILNPMATHANSDSSLLTF